MRMWLEERVGSKISRDEHDEGRFKEEVEPDREWEITVQGKRHYSRREQCDGRRKKGEKVTCTRRREE